MALARSAASIIGEIRDRMNELPAEELPEGECSVKVAGEWYGYAGLERGQLVLWGEGDRCPSLYPPSEGETFPWRPLIGGAA